MDWAEDDVQEHERHAHTQQHLGSSSPQPASNANQPAMVASADTAATPSSTSAPAAKHLDKMAALTTPNVDRQSYAAAALVGRAEHASLHSMHA
jgi:hypothetical protein